MTTKPPDTVRLSRADATVSELVVEAISICVGAEPTDLGVTLYDVVDPDALDRLFGVQTDGTPRVGGQVTFSIADCTVEVTDETVSATPNQLA
ncbi:HalOD1 output domain-containing protein [Halorussus halophilus]|uniref:HalOD1 output domain-containing protein n=1 Tax=Halorussus halophilus TaxID=2650975 RepID=UPI001300D316|nr:HalOD1 output domain-containing protein [Halorussus halophilus]